MVARRDVELVIRARNEATPALERISQTLQKFDQQQERSQQQSRETGTAFDRIGVALRELQGSLGGLGALAQVGQNIERAAASVQRLQTELAESTTETRGYEQSLRAVERRLRTLDNRSARYAQTIRESRTGLRQAKADHRDFGREVGRLTNRQRQLRASLAETNRAIRREGRIERDLIQRTNQAAATENLRLFPDPAETRRNREELVRLRTEQDRLQGELRETDATLREQRGSFNTAARAIRTHEGRIRRSTEAQKENAAAAKVVRDELRRVGSEARRAAREQARIAGNLEQAEAAYNEYQASLAGTEAEVRQLEQRLRGPFLRAFQEQRERVNRAARDLREYGSETGRLARLMRQTEAPSRQLVAAFQANRAAAAGARQEYRHQQGELQRLRTVIRETGGDTDTLARRQERVAAVLRRSAEHYGRHASRIQQAAGASRAFANAQNQSKTAIDRVRTSTRRLQVGLRRASGEARSFTAALRQISGGTRTTLSFMQRLRGEVLSLIAAYGGLFAAIRGVQQVLQASITTQTVQNRLRVVFGGDTEAVAREYDFLRRSAERLGISFGVLAQEYSKFAIATRGTNLEGRATRDVFLSVAEAARVQNLSVEQIEGAFLAITQIVSKSVVSMEELRRQLADRIPGAVPLFARGVNIGVDRLIKLVETGELSADALILFARELFDSFGPQVEGALDQAAASVGRFGDAVFLTGQRIGQEGGLDAISDFFNRLNDLLRSADFISFANRLAVGIGALASAIATAAENFRVLAALFASLVFVRFRGLIAAIVVQLVRLPRLFRIARYRARRFNRELSATAGAATRASVALRRLGRSLRGVLASSGIGLALATIGTALALWVTRSDEATEALTEHQRILDEVTNAYEKAADSAQGLEDAANAITLLEARENVTRVREEVQRLQQDLLDAGRDLPGAIGGLQRRTAGGGQPRNEIQAAFQEVQDLLRGVISGRTSIPEAQRRLDEFAGSADELGDGFVRSLTVVSRILTQLQARTETAAAAFDLLLLKQAQLRGDDEAIAAIEARLFGTVAASADENAVRVDLYRKALVDLRAELPKLLRELNRVEENAPFQGGPELIRGEVFDNFNESISLVRELANAAGIAQDEVDGLEATFRALAAAARLFGSTRSGIEASIRLLTAATGRPYDEVVKRVDDARSELETALGRDVFSAFSARAQALIVEVVDQLGGVTDDLETAVRQALEAGTLEPLREFLRSGTSDVLAAAREGAILGDNVDTGRAGEAFSAERRRIRIRIRSLQDQILAQRTINNGLERQGEIDKEIAAFRQRNPGISDEELAEVRRLTQLLAAERDEYQRINQLLELRSGLLQQIQAATATGDDSGAQALRNRVAEINSLLQSAVLEALDLVRSLGSSDPQVLARINELRAVLLQIRSDEQDAILQRVDALRQLQQALESEIGTRQSFNLPLGDLNIDLRETRDLLRQAAEDALGFLEALDSDDPAIRARISEMRTLIASLGQMGDQITLTFAQVRDAFAGSFADALKGFAQAVAEGRSAIGQLDDAFRRFASNFLLQIADMIIQQLALNAAQMALGFFGFGPGSSIGIGAGGGGGAPIADSFAGVAPDSFGSAATAAETDRAVGDRSDFRPGGGDLAAAVRVVNAFDSASFLEEALRTRGGEQVLLNRVTARRSEFRSALGIV